MESGIVRIVSDAEYTVRGELDWIPHSVPQIEIIGLPGQYIFPGPEWPGEPYRPELPTPQWPNEPRIRLPGAEIYLR